MSSRSEYRWIADDVVLAVHEAQIDEHGGTAGIRDPALLASALARPQNAAAYGETGIAELAALYALGVIKNHPFIDGNKRVGAVLLEIFLEEHNCELNVSDQELFRAIMALAASETSETAFISWVRAHARKSGNKRRK